MLTLFTREGTGRPARARWALEEAGLPYELVALTSEECASEAHRRRHPLGRVPALETGSGTLFESAALCLQVADLAPAAGLIPAIGSQERGEVYQWAVFSMSELEPAILRVYALGDERSTDAAVAARAKLAAVYDALASRLETVDYLVGNRFTVADIAVGGVLAVAEVIGLLPDSAAIAGYARRLAARPAHQRVFEGFLAGLARR